MNIFYKISFSFWENLCDIFTIIFYTPRFFCMFFILLSIFPSCIIIIFISHSTIAAAIRIFMTSISYSYFVTVQIYQNNVVSLGTAGKQLKQITQDISSNVHNSQSKLLCNLLSENACFFLLCRYNNLWMHIGSICYTNEFINISLSGKSIVRWTMEPEDAENTFLSYRKIRRQMAMESEGVEDTFYLIGNCIIRRINFINSSVYISTICI